MAKKPVIDVGAKTAPVGTAVAKREGHALLTPLQAAVLTLPAIINGPADYDLYDEMFGRIKQARKVWKGKMYGTTAKPGPISAIRSGLDQLYAINREVDKPLEDMETQVEAPMKRYLLQLKREQDERDAERQREIDAANERIAALEAKQAALKTPTAQARVEQEIIEVAEELDAIQTQADPEPVQSTNSSNRPKQIPVVIAWGSFIQGIADGLIPDDIVTLNAVKLRQYFKDDPASVKDFPGVEIQDDIQIVGR